MKTSRTMLLALQLDCSKSQQRRKPACMAGGGTCEAFAKRNPQHQTGNTYVTSPACYQISYRQRTRSIGLQCLQTDNEWIIQTASELPKVCLGTMLFGEGLDSDASNEMLEVAWDRGVRFFDTVRTTQHTRHLSILTITNRMPSSF